MMQISPGWRFYAADFSVPERPGCATLVRQPDEVARWHKMPDDAKEDEDNCPPLFVSGRGMTFEEAIADANQIAENAKPIAELEAGK